MRPAITDMKVVLLGQEYVGKTRLVDRYLHERFSNHMDYQTVSINYFEI